MSTIDKHLARQQILRLADAMHAFEGDLSITFETHLHRVPHGEMEDIIKELADDPDAATYHMMDDVEWKRFTVGGIKVAAFYESYGEKKERERNVYNRTKRGLSPQTGSIGVDAQATAGQPAEVSGDG